MGRPSAAEVALSIQRRHTGDVPRGRPRVLDLHHRLHDARHFYAIRRERAGTPYELVARQLGHADVQMVARVYGRYAPRSDERDRWEKLAALLDEAPAEITGEPSPDEKVANGYRGRVPCLRTNRVNHS